MTSKDDLEYLSSACAVAIQFGPESGHGDCRLTEDIPMPHSKGRLVLIPRCRCTCHTARVPEGEHQVSIQPLSAEPVDPQALQPVSNPNPDCARCGELAEERAQAARDGDLSRVTDCNVMIRTHGTGHSGTPAPKGES
ncbi:hypothetical protein ACVNF4_10875 [Streptomyces sp. S6]